MLLKHDAKTANVFMIRLATNTGVSKSNLKPGKDGFWCIQKALFFSALKKLLVVF
jgi:hypothetical protein